MANEATKEVQEEVYAIEEDMYKEAMEEELAHMKMGLTSQMSSINLKMQSGTYS